MTFEVKYGLWALVTGAGRASEIRKAQGVYAISIGMDLGQKGFIEDLIGAVGDREVLSDAFAVEGRG